MKPYPSYKPTGLKWLPEVPQGWEMLHLFQVAHETCCKNVGCREMNVLSLSFGSIKRKQDIYAGLSPTDFATYQIVEPGNTILRLTDLQNDKRSLRTGLVKERGIITSAYTCVVPHGNADYLHYALHTLDLHKIYYGLGGGVRQSIGFKEIRQLQIPVPPLPEQAAIAAYLDAKTAKFDRLIKLKEREIELLQEKKQAVISSVVTRGLDPNVKLVDSGVDWIGKVPRGWKKDKVSRCFNIIGSGTTPESSNTAYFLGGTIPWVNSGDVYAKGRYFYETEKKVTELALKKCAALKFFPRKSIVIAMYGGSIGNMSIADFEFCCNQACCCLAEARKDVLLDYVFLVLSCAKEYWLTLSSGGGQPNISQEKIRRTWVPLPPLEEQRKIVAYLDAETAKTDRTVAVVRRQIELLREYRTRLISDAVTGRIDLREAVA